jgi:DNA-binding MarR family transcriptional regulator
MSLRMPTRIEKKKPATPPDYELSDLEQRCTQALLTILPQMRQIVHRESTELSLTVQQYSVLKALKERDLLISELADLLRVSRPTMSRIIDGLEGRRKSANGNTNGNGNRHPRPKLVERVASQDDHRLVYTRITDEGRAVLRHYGSQAEESLKGLLRTIPPEDVPVFLRCLENIDQALARTKSEN